MEKKIKIKWLKAIKILRKHYEKYELDKIPVSYANATSESCPLCVVAKTMITGSICFNCPWILFEHNECFSLLFFMHTTRERLKRLDNWEKRIKNGEF